MDAGTPPVAPSRHRFLRWYGALAAALLVLGGGCLAFGNSGNVGWLERLDWHLDYDHLGVLLLWLGALLVLPQLASSFWARRGPGRNPAMRRRVGLAVGAAVALLVLTQSPDNFSISRYRQSAYADDRDPGQVDDPSAHTEDTYSFLGFRDMRWTRLAEDDEETGTPQTHTAWRGAHASWFGTKDTYEWHALDNPEATPLEDQVYGDDQPQGYECLIHSMSFAGPFQALHLVNVDRSADPSRYPACRRVMRFAGRTLSPEDASRAYLAEAGDTPLAHAVAQALPQMSDTEVKASQGETALVRWMATHPLTWADLQRLPKTEAAAALKDIHRQRGKLACVTGKLRYITPLPMDDISPNVGEIGDPETGMYRFTAVRSAGRLAEHSPATFCGIVIGRSLLSDLNLDPVVSLGLVGMFDLPENR